MRLKIPKNTELGWPYCSTCKKPVDEVFKEYGKELIFIAICHGREEIVIVPNEFCYPPNDARNNKRQVFSIEGECFLPFKSLYE